MIWPSVLDDGSPADDTLVGLEAVGEDASFGNGEELIAEDDCEDGLLVCDDADGWAHGAREAGN